MRNDAAEFFAPIVKALELEGFYNFKPACYDHNEVNVVRPTCTHGSPWAEIGQKMMSNISEPTKIEVDDNAHRV